MKVVVEVVKVGVNLEGDVKIEEDVKEIKDDEVKEDVMMEDVFEFMFELLECFCEYKGYLDDRYMFMVWKNEVVKV